jgi:hypothetical protein
MLYFNEGTSGGYSLWRLQRVLLLVLLPELYPHGVYYQFGYPANPEASSADWKGGTRLKQRPLRRWACAERTLRPAALEKR